MLNDEVDFAGLPGIRRTVQHALDTMLEEAEELKVLEAGCGSASHLRFGPNVAITGIDISETALVSNSILRERICGDIQTYDLPESEFDFVSCWNVLEHVASPRQAIANLARTLSPGGLIVLATPNVLSFEALLTKLTPHWFHVFVYKHVFDRKDAGKDGYAPFRTYLRLSIAPKRLEKFVTGLGLEIVQSQRYALESQMLYLRRTHPAVYWAYKVFARASQILSLGMIHPYHSAYIALLRKRDSACCGMNPGHRTPHASHRRTLRRRMTTQPS